METFKQLARNSRVIGASCATAAVALGAIYMLIAGAPARLPIINGCALAIGLMALPLVRHVANAQATPARAQSALMLAIALCVLATALFGTSVEGAARWAVLFGFYIQPGLVLLPAMLVLYSRSSSALNTVAICIAACAVALQPDRALAGMMVAAILVQTILQRDQRGTQVRHIRAALAMSLAAFAVTIIRADTLPVSAYVDQILYTSFDAHWVAGIAVWCGSILLVVPAIIGWRFRAEQRNVYAVFGVVWFASIVAAAMGNYPTPLVGYSGAAVLGYVLSLAAFPAAMSTAPQGGPTARARTKHLPTQDQELFAA
jgi:hypothetical protein